MAALNAMRPRPELFVTALDAPPRLAPYTWAFSVEADAGRPAGEDLDEPDTSGRLILLHDPAGQDAWEGTFRLVCFVQARLEPEQLGDEMLPVVAWSWLTEALEHNDAPYTALGGTVTQTSSVRFGDISGPRRDDDVELRASWTPVGPELTAPRGRVLRARGGSSGPTSGRSSSAGPSDGLIPAFTCGFDAFSDQYGPPFGWLGINNAVTFTLASSMRYTTLDRLGGYAPSLDTFPGGQTDALRDRGSGAGRGQTTDSREVVTWPWLAKAHPCAV